jgi:hypothetical protein
MDDTRDPFDAGLGAAAGAGLGAGFGADVDTDSGPGTHSRAVGGPVDLHVEAGSGSVTVHAVQTGTCTVEVGTDGRSRSGADGTTVRWHGDTVEVRVPRSVGFLGRDAAVDLTITVPTGSSAELATRSGAIRTSGALSHVRTATGSGDVSVEHVTGFVRSTSGSGRIDLGTVGEVQLRSGSGDVRIGRCAGRIEAGTGSGDVHVGEAGSDVQVSSGSGDVTVRSSSGDLTVSTASGDVELGGAASGHVTVKTASGDVSVTVPAGTDVLLDCSSVSGRLRSDLEATSGPQEGSSVLQLRARTVSGDVDVRRG